MKMGAFSSVPVLTPPPPDGDFGGSGEETPNGIGKFVKRDCHLWGDTPLQGGEIKGVPIFCTYGQFRQDYRSDTIIGSPFLRSLVPFLHASSEVSGMAFLSTPKT